MATTRKKRTAPTRRATGKRAPAGKAAPRAAKASWIPRGAHVVTPYLSVRDAEKAIAFYAEALGAKEKKGARFTMPDGRIGHTEMRIGDAEVYLADEFEGMEVGSPAALGGTTVSLHVYVRNVDKAFEKAIGAGAKPLQSPTDMFWGDRFAKLVDPFGHVWSLARHLEDLTPAQMRQRAETFFSGS